MTTTTFARRALASGVGLLPLRALAVSFTANFDGLNRNANLGATVTEGGLTFTSTDHNLLLANGVFASVLFGDGGNPNYANGNALFVHNSGWVAITAPGYQIDSLNFFYGFDWNFYTIEYGLMDTTFGWEALSNGVIVAQGSQTWGRDNRTHGGFGLTVNPSALFDTLLIRSTAVEYQGIYQFVPQPPNFWNYERGPVVGFGNENNIAFDRVTVVGVASVPDISVSGFLFAVALAGLWCVRSRRIQLP